MRYTVLENGMIRRESDGALIPQDPANMDYKAYLRWVETGDDAIQVVTEDPPSVETL
jgi:hypothetical protein